MWERFVELIYRTTLGRTAGVVANSIIGGLLTNWVIADLSAAGSGVQWRRAPDSLAFWLLVAFVSLFVIYSIGLYKFERDIYRWNKPEYLTAHLRQQLFPIRLEKAKGRIKKGEIVTLAELERELLGDGNSLQ